MGKTTRSDLLVQHLGVTPVYEEYGDNPYLAKFYENKERWAFQSQQWFLKNKLAQMEKIQTLLDDSNTQGIIQDMAIYQDAAFAHNLYAQKYISETDWRKYEELLEEGCKTIPQPVVFHLTAEIPSILKRIHERGREFEKNVDATYLKGLKKSIEYWLEKVSSHVTIVEFGTEGLDLANDSEQQQEFVTFAKHYLDIPVSEFLELPRNSAILPL